MKLRHSAAIVLACLALAACSNTMTGAGQDLQNAGANLQSKATGAPPPPSPQNNYGTPPALPPLSQ
ncbi:MAG: hypothetical protein JO122_17635 [Acetobacteraceae bacterium]|nr:hypothetical protein [Acetobacteraceae bacterium]